MKFIYFIFLINCYVVTRGDKLIPYEEVKCPSTLGVPFKYKLQATLLDLDGKTNEDLMTCVIKGLYVDQSVLLISGYYTNSVPMLQKYKTTNNPNVIIMMKFVHTDMLLLPSIKRVLRSHRSIVYIAIVNDKLNICKDGQLNPKEFTKLQTFMNELWRTYKIMQAVVTFPFSCKGKIAVYHGKQNTSKTLYDRTIKLINRTNTEQLYATIGQRGQLLTEGYPLKADIFFRYPTAIVDCKNLHYYTKMNLNDTKGFCGLDALVMYNIVKYFKFKLYFPNTDTCDKYGYAMPGNITGSLGCVVRQELDISFNSRFMTMYSEDDIYFLHYITTDSLCVMVRRAGVIPIWHYPISVYENKVWLLIMVLTVIIGIFVWGVATLKSKINRRRRRASLYNYIRDIFTSTIFGFSLFKHKNLYILRGACLCSSIILIAAVQGHINHMFTALLRYETLKTLDDLYRSGKKLYVSPSIRAILKQLESPDNQEQRYFLQQTRTTPENYTLEYIVKYPHAALLGRKQDAMMEILSQYMDKNESPLISIVDECFYTYYLNYVARTGFPFYEELQRFMQRIGEAGLPIIYYRWSCNMLRVPQSLPKIRSEPRCFEQIKLVDQRVAFGILIFGYIVSFFVFLIELVTRRRHQKKCRRHVRFAN